MLHEKKTVHGFIRVIGYSSQHMELVGAPRRAIGFSLINFIVPRKFAGVNDNGVASDAVRRYYVVIVRSPFPIYRHMNSFLFSRRLDI